MERRNEFHTMREKGRQRRCALDFAEHGGEKEGGSALSSNCDAALANLAA
jgi:hypothetical protein